LQAEVEEEEHGEKVLHAIADNFDAVENMLENDGHLSNDNEEDDD